MRFGLIGNCSYQALIDDRGCVNWLCWPRFDSSFVFGSLLDSERGGTFSIQPAGDDWTSVQRYVPNTNVLHTRFDTPRGSFELLDFAPRFSQYERFIKPTMLIRRLRLICGSPRVRVRCTPVYDYGRLQPNPVISSNHIQWDLGDASLRLTTDVPLSYVLESQPFVLARDADLVLTCGIPLEAPLAETAERFLYATQRYWETWVKHLRLPGICQAEVIRSALALKLHQFEDTGAITASATTSLPEAQGAGRNWDYRFCWIRDAAFVVGALMKLGHFEELEQFERYLESIVGNAGATIQPVYSVSGDASLSEETLDHLAGFRGNLPVRIGNLAHAQRQHDVYGEMIRSIAPLFLDLRFRSEPSLARLELIDYLLDGMSRTVGQPDVGLWEKRDKPRVHTFTQLMHWSGARTAKRIAESLKDEARSLRAQAIADRARTEIEKAWRPAGYFADAVDTDHVDASLFMMVNLGYLQADEPRATRHVRELHARLAAKPHIHLLRRYVHPDGLGETEVTFTICGFWYAEALARLGEKQEATQVMEALIRHANHLGLLSEDIDPRDGSQWGNFPQSYSHVGLINAAFAIEPWPLALV
ncbi:MAG: glycoside hydrolase family 15 protein [Nannocystaceae bacterium]